MSVIYDELCSVVGRSYMAQHNYRFRTEHRDLFMKRIMEDREIPVFPYEIDHVSYMDGCKVYFKNGGWVSIRFSGTEPLLRVFAEMETQEQAEEICEICRQFLGIS